MQNRQNGSTGSNSGSSFDSFFNSNPSHSMGSASSGNQSASSANWNTEQRIFPSCRMKCILKRCFLKNALFMPGILTIPRSNAWQKTLPGITAGILIRFTAI